MPAEPEAGPAPLGAVLAGGENRRYGSLKALAEVGGSRIVDRVVAALGRVVPDVVLLANEPALFEDVGLPARPDLRPGLGALGGIHTALVWARERGRPGILAVACDMPFPSVALLERLRAEAFAFGPSRRSLPEAGPGTATASPHAPAAPRPDVVVPASRSRRGVEPLFAAYGVGCIVAIEARLDAGDRRVVGFHEDVRVRTLPLDVVEALCDPERAFLNVNTPDERDRAERLARQDEDAGGARSGGHGRESR